MIRLFLKSLGVLLLFAGFAALTYDGIRTLANGELAASPGSQIWLTLSPGTYENARNWLNGAVPYAWNTIVTPMLLLPAWILLTAAGTLVYLAGYRPKPPEIISEI